MPEVDIDDDTLHFIDAPQRTRSVSPLTRSLFVLLMLTVLQNLLSMRTGSSIGSSASAPLLSRPITSFKRNQNKQLHSSSSASQSRNLTTSFQSPPRSTVPYQRPPTIISVSSDADPTPPDTNSLNTTAQGSSLMDLPPLDLPHFDPLPTTFARPLSAQAPTTTSLSSTPPSKGGSTNPFDGLSPSESRFSNTSPISRQAPTSKPSHSHPTPTTSNNPFDTYQGSVPSSSHTTITSSSSPVSNNPFDSWGTHGTQRKSNNPFE